MYLKIKFDESFNITWYFILELLINREPPNDDRLSHQREEVEIMHIDGLVQDCSKTIAHMHT